MSDLSDLLLGKNSTAKTKPTYADYATWVADASADNEITKDEWKQGASLFGFNAKKARKAFKSGNFDSYMSPYRNKLERNYYAWRDPNTGKVSLIAQGDDNWDEEAFQNAKFKGTDRNKVATAYNDAVADARKKAQVTYGNDGRYHITYKVGDWDVNDVDVTDADWFKDDKTRQKNAQLYSYGKAVDSYYAKPVDQKYLGADGLNLLKAIGYDVKNVDGFDSKEDSDKQTIRDNIGYKLRSWYADQAGNSWDSSAKADALWKHLMEYYNGKGIAWLPTLDWQTKSRYKDYTQLGTAGNSSAHGSLIGFSKKGGFLRARTLAKGGNINMLRIGGNSWWRTAADFVPVVGTGLLAADKLIDHDDDVSWGDVALSGGTDLAGILLGGGAGKVLGKLASKGIKYVSKAGKLERASAKLVSAKKKISTAIEEQRQLENLAKSRNLSKNTQEKLLKAIEKKKSQIKDLQGQRFNMSSKTRNIEQAIQEAKANKAANAVLYPFKTKATSVLTKTGALAGKAALRVLPMIGTKAIISKNFPAQGSGYQNAQNPEQSTESTDSSTSSTGSIEQNESETAYTVDPNTGARVPVVADSEYTNSQVTTI